MTIDDIDAENVGGIGIGIALEVARHDGGPGVAVWIRWLVNRAGGQCGYSRIRRMTVGRLDHDRKQEDGGDNKRGTRRNQVILSFSTSTMAPALIGYAFQQQPQADGSTHHSSSHRTR